MLFILFIFSSTWSVYNPLLSVLLSLPIRPAATTASRMLAGGAKNIKTKNQFWIALSY